MPIRQPALLFVLFFLFALLPLPAASDDPGALRVGLTDFPPYSSLDADGESRGFLPEVLRRAFRAVDARVELPTRPVARLKAELDSGHLDCRLASRDDPPRPDLHYGSEPVYRLTMALWTRADRAELAELPDVRRIALHDVRWGLVHGLSYTPELRRLVGSNPVLSADDDVADLRNLVAGRIDVTVADVASFLHRARDLGVEDRVLRIGETTFPKEYLLACRRDALESRGGPAFLGGIDAALEDLRASGDVGFLAARHLPGGPMPAGSR